MFKPVCWVAFLSEPDKVGWHFTHPAADPRAGPLAALAVSCLPVTPSQPPAALSRAARAVPLSQRRLALGPGGYGPGAKISQPERSILAWRLSDRVSGWATSCEEAGQTRIAWIEWHDSLLGRLKERQGEQICRDVAGCANTYYA